MDIQENKYSFLEVLEELYKKEVVNNVVLKNKLQETSQAYSNFVIGANDYEIKTKEQLSSLREQVFVRNDDNNKLRAEIEKLEKKLKKVK